MHRFALIRGDDDGEAVEVVEAIEVGSGSHFSLVFVRAAVWRLFSLLILVGCSDAAFTWTRGCSWVVCYSVMS